MTSRPEKIGNYVIEHMVGRGATSEVWLARHAYLEERLVALKILLSQDIETIQRFSLEANILSHLQHPNIVQVYDHGYYEPYYYSVIEYIHGCSLQNFLDRYRRLEFLDALHVVKQIAAALDYAHSLEIIHRDVSPGNVLIEEETRRVMLTDFGIARDSRQPITVDHKIMGTPGYWSPEHTRSSKDVTHLSDIYGLGVIFYVLLCGDLPWDAIPGSQDHPFVKPLPIKQRGVTNLPGEVDRIIQTMLAIDPAKRYPRARDAIDELDRLATRHHSTTQVVSPESGNNGTQPAATSADGTVVCETAGVTPDDVERVLGADLVRAPIAQAHERATTLCQPGEVARLLDAWSRQGFYRGFFRRSVLGRVARLHSVRSHNVYFYTLRVLYEQRGQPAFIEEPDHKAEEFPLEPEIGIWHVPLPSVQEFADDAGGQATVPGSVRVVQCEKCSGKGKIVCARCKGKQRIKISRPVEPGGAAPQQSAARSSKPQGNGKTAPRPAQARRAPAAQAATASKTAATSVAAAPQTEEVIIPCPNCEGRGGLQCETCEGTGRMVQHKAFRWRRTARVFEDHDDLGSVDTDWLFRACNAQVVYQERVVGNAQSNAPALAPEWGEVAGLKDMLESARGATSEQARIILSELTITMIPVTQVIFDMDDMEKRRGKHDNIYTLSIWGFEQRIPDHWELLNWERVVSFWVLTFMLLLVIIMGYVVLL